MRKKVAGEADRMRARRRGPCACSRAPSRSRLWPKCPTGRLCASAGGASCTTSPPSRGRSASPRPGGGARPCRRATISAPRILKAAASGSTARAYGAARPRRRNGSCMGCSDESLRPACGEKGGVIRLEPRFAELSAMTNFSFLRGASHPEEMVARSAELGLAGIGIADRNTLAGVVRAHVFARENAAAMGATRVVPGARLAFDDGAPDVLAYPKNRAAYGRLCRILTAGNLRAPKGECRLRLDDLVELGEGLQVVALPLIRPRDRAFVRTPVSGQATARPPSPASGRRDSPSLPFTGEGRREGKALARLREAFGQRLWIGASLTYGEHMRGGLARRMGLARQVGAPLIATNDALMHAPERRPLADVLACIREGTTLEAAGCLTQANAERHLKAPDEMARLFAEAPQAVAETMRFLDGLSFSLDELSHRYPEELREGYATH